MNRTALFVTARNRRKNKNNARRRKSNWLRPEQRESLEQLSKAKNLILQEDIFSSINLTDQQLTEDELNVCKLGLKFITTVKRYDSSDSSILSKGEEITEFSKSWKPKLKFDPSKTDNQDLELFLDTMAKELLNPKKENRVQDNLNNTEREAFYRLTSYNRNIKPKNLIRTRDKGSSLVIECKKQYIKEMFSYLSNKETFQEDESDQSKMYQHKVNNWRKS